MKYWPIFLAYVIGILLGNVATHFLFNIDSGGVRMVMGIVIGTIGGSIVGFCFHIWWVVFYAPELLDDDK